MQVKDSLLLRIMVRVVRAIDQTVSGLVCWKLNKQWKYMIGLKLVSQQIPIRQVYRICRQVKTHNRVRSNPTGID